MLNNKKYYFAFSLVENFGPISFQKIKKHFPDLKFAWQASGSELIKAGVTDKVISEIIDIKNKINLEQELEKIFKQNINIITLEDKEYPELLREISNPPFLLYYQGKLEDPRDKCSLAVVGTRKISSYGKLVTEKLVRDLTNNNITIISGLALGVDAAAHESCLNNHGRTIAVLGSGIDRQVFYPRDNWRLGQKIINQDGLIVSEYPPLTKAQRHLFPQRNRIVAGLGLGTLVTEAPIKSGALLTAKLALEQNREVFAVPGQIYSINSTGTHNLIKLGAKLVDCADDIFNELNLPESKMPELIYNSAITPTEKLIFEYLLINPAPVDELIRETKLDSSIINSTLTLMEISGKIKNLDGIINLIK